MNPENRNMILAITLSMAVLFGWQMFVVGPELEKEAAMQQAIAEQEAATAAASGDAPQVDPDAVAGSAGAAARFASYWWRVCANRHEVHGGGFTKARPQDLRHAVHLGM